MLRTIPSRFLPPLAALLLLPAATPEPSGLALLRATAESYRAAPLFLLEGDIRADVRSGDRAQSTNASFRVAIGGGGKVLDELDHPQMGATRVSDGHQTWIYRAAENQYLHRLESGPVDAQQAQSGGGIVGTLLAVLRGLGDGVDSLVALPDETIPFGGADRRCAVLEVRYRPGFGGPTLPGVPRTFWIDRERHLVLQHRTVTRATSPDRQRSVEQSETFRYRTIALDSPPEAGLFTFQPPPGAKKVDQFASSSRGVEDLSGQAATDFTLADLSGKKHSLKALRGKVVMLDFWASWCGPCRRQMPLVEKLGKELESKGLVVYAVNQGESAETARRYLEKYRYATTTLLDRKLEVGRRYKAVGIPTLVIIDREGKIAAHYVGLRDEVVLREGLRKAGL